jgi:hypothetical protein
MTPGLFEGGVPIVDLYEQIAKDRIAAALREAEERRALRSGHAHRLARGRLRSVLTRLRRWVLAR